MCASGSVCCLGCSTLTVRRFLDTLENWTLPVRRSRSRDDDSQRRRDIRSMRPKRIEPKQRPAAAIEGLRPFTAKQGQYLAFIITTARFTVRRRQSQTFNGISG